MKVPEIRIEKAAGGNIGTRTIDPAQGFSVSGNTLTIYNFASYKSCKHNCSATTTVVELSGTKVLLRVESIDWVKGQQYPFKTQGCFFVQLEIGKRGRAQIGVDRVPCSIQTIEDAISFLTPSEVKKAIEAGKKVLRQGDFFFVEMAKKGNLDALLASNHKPVETKRGLSIRHPEHPALMLPANTAWKAVQRKTMNHIKAD